MGVTASFAVLSFGSLFALGTPPAAAESGPQVVAWFRENRDAVRWAVWMLTVAIPPAAVMIALLRRLLPSPDRDVFLVGGVIFLGMGGVFTWTLAGLALHPDTLEPAIARTVLVRDLAAFHAGRATETLDELHARYRDLVLRVIALLEPGDASLAHDLTVSTDQLWATLADPGQFASLAKS